MNDISNCIHEFEAGPSTIIVTRKCKICSRIELQITKKLMDEIHIIIINDDGSRTEIS